MKKGCLISIGVLVILVIGLLISAKWFLKEAFGPSYRDFEIQLSSDKKLIGQETYMADFAAVFYDVELNLISDYDTTRLGRTTFNSEGWEKNLELLELNDWSLLLVKGNTYFQVLGANKKRELIIDTTFSPLELRYDSLWKGSNADIPAWTYTGTSKIDSITETSFYVTYHYRMGLYEPFEFYDQTILYSMNQNTGQFKSTQIFEPKKKK